ncbi:hypothetical protein [Streptomyces sp. NPDC047829]|uniref:hypothetical protein n=1 Tax=Streptomyces sp. NPDC047829 TaxID=3154609 RepID=UPI0033C316C3
MTNRILFRRHRGTAHSSAAVDRDVLARQIAREEEQRRALAAFLDGWDAAGGGAPT